MTASNQRFVDFSEREFVSAIHNYYSDYLPEFLAKVRLTKWHHTKWRGLTLMKDPMSLSIYQQMLQELRPATILEFGTFEGGSALWMRDQLAACGIACQIHTFDINADRVRLPACDNLHFHQLDNHQIEQFVADHQALFDNLAHPVLVIEDAHENADGVLTVLDHYLRPGDYLVVEDTLSIWKHDMLSHFIVDKSYLVDTHYCDLWGYNNSWNINSIFKKV
ncbi:hypothetical protein A5320_18205 [Rheinheimera sp. SA_1]|uniref:CmcI family methyltransferase n=1 Tax=Rheinheimera sp. SA_1 TaxID=1827365 RepID=UPI0007FF315E|nr:CmcI family methyltransferase [Rheinheimera sp. SA_1]OBP13482.1 hypothetical protein A5320_18205 [Rheinheimera sp. SA_1]